MSDDYRTERIPSFPGASEFPGEHPMPRRRAYGAYANSSVATASTPQDHDVASIFGVAPESLPPGVLAALQRLLGEVGQIRGQLDAAERHRRQLEDQGDLFPGLPCLNGHAFIRELDAFLNGHSATIGQEWGQLAVIHTGGIEHAVGQLGLGAGDRALKHVWDILHRAALSGEPLAYLGFGTFSWLLIGQGSEVFQDRLASVAETLRQSPPMWYGQQIALDVSIGVAPLLAGQGAIQALNDADTDRLEQRVDNKPL